MRMVLCHTPPYVRTNAEGRVTWEEYLARRLS
jgi:hypothetical protein